MSKIPDEGRPSINPNHDSLSDAGSYELIHRVRRSASGSLLRGSAGLLALFLATAAAQSLAHAHPSSDDKNQSDPTLTMDPTDVPHAILVADASASGPLETHELMKLLRDGDLVFHTSKSSQSAAIQTVTHSPFSHVGIVFNENGEWMVLEAVQPVKFTPFAEWRKRGKNNKIAIKRVKGGASINMDSLLTEGRRHLGKPYDPLFDWDEDDMYCSELVYKLFMRSAGIAIGQLEPLKDLDFSSAEAQRLLVARLGVRGIGRTRLRVLATLLRRYKTPGALMASSDWGRVSPWIPHGVVDRLSSTLVTPASMYGSDQLMTVYNDFTRGNRG